MPSISCLVCLDNFVQNVEAVSINRCGHVFHLECLNEWRSRKQGLANTCPLCRTNYNKRSLTKLFFGVAETENDIKKDLQKLEEERTREKDEKNKYINELNVVKEELGIKNQAYHIIDSVNNEYLQCNQRLKEQNEKLLAESNRIREEMEALKKKLQPPPPPPPLVDLTSVEISDDDEIQFVSATKIPKVIEGVVEINDDDDDDDVQIVTDCANNNKINHQEISQSSGNDDYGHTIRPIETTEERAIPEVIDEVPAKNEFIPFLSEGHSSNVILNDNQIVVEKEVFVKTEEHADAQSIIVTPDVTHLTFGDIPHQNEPPSFHSDFESDEPVYKKHKFEHEMDFSFLRDYLSQT